MLQYSDLGRHKETCKYNTFTCCPIDSCQKQLIVDAKRVCEHLSTSHNIVAAVSSAAHDGVFPNVRFQVHDYQKEHVKRKDVFEETKLFQVNSVFFLLSMIESEMHIQFRSFFFSDTVVTGGFTMQKIFRHGADPEDHLLLSERVKCLSSMQTNWSSKKKKQPSCEEIKSLLNNDTIFLHKRGLTAACYNDNATDAASTIELSIKLIKSTSLGQPDVDP